MDEVGDEGMSPNFFNFFYLKKLTPNAESWAQYSAAADSCSFKIKMDQNGLKGKLYTGGKGMAPHAQLSTRFVLGLF